MAEWRKCSVCKKSIDLGADYFVCSVSSCRKSAFCSVECWDVHSGVMNHKSAGAMDAKAPSQLEEENASAPRRFIVTTQNPQSSSTISTEKELPHDILIVASKLKDYVKEAHELSTSANVMDRLSDLVREWTDKAARNAKAEGRKTLMDRDFF